MTTTAPPTTWPSVRAEHGHVLLDSPDGRTTETLTAAEADELSRALARAAKTAAGHVTEVVRYRLRPDGPWIESSATGSPENLADARQEMLTMLESAAKYHGCDVADLMDGAA